MHACQRLIGVSLLTLLSVTIARAEEYLSTETYPCDSQSACEECCDDCCKGPLLGYIQPTDPAWAGFISPMTNPVFFEDPRTLTEARFIFIDHELPALAGGAIAPSRLQVLAVQLRAAITEDLSIIATKDGFIWPTALAPLDDGWADVALGLKYNAWKDVCCQNHWMSNGAVAAFDGIQGGDFFNLGSTGVAGTDIVTGAFGVKYKPSLLNEIGLAYELPVTNTRGVLQHRLTMDYILRY
jgi:hypothetical protein